MDERLQARYSRHILLPQVGLAGQQRLNDARVLIVGLGGLGSPVAMYLAASGVGQLILSDFDHVEISNLQRQIIHTTPSIGLSKVASAGATIRALNPEIDVIELGYALDDDELFEQVAAANVVIDASDNFETRFTVNRTCWAAGTPLVSGAAIRMEGQVSVFDPSSPDSPCYRCLYTDTGDQEGEPCARVGVLAPLLGIIGSVQATEAIKLIVGMGESLCGRVVVIDAFDMTWRSFNLRKDPKCPVCAQQ